MEKNGQFQLVSSACTGKLRDTSTLGWGDWYVGLGKDWYIELGGDWYSEKDWYRRTGAKPD